MKVKTFKIVSGTRKLSLSLVVFMAKIRTIPQSPVVSSPNYPLGTSYYWLETEVSPTSSTAKTPTAEEARS